MRKNASAIIAAIFLALPMLYVASYLVLVNPTADAFNPTYTRQYRWGRRWAATFYWPLEKMDRRVRPKEWEPDLLFIRSRDFVRSNAHLHPPAMVEVHQNNWRER